MKREGGGGGGLRSMVVRDDNEMAGKLVAVSSRWGRHDIDDTLAQSASDGWCFGRIAADDMMVD